MWNLRGALSGDTPASQYGVLVGLRVTRIFGRAAPLRGRSWCPCRATRYPVSCYVGPSIDGWKINIAYRPVDEAEAYVLQKRPNIIAIKLQKLLRDRRGHEHAPKPGIRRRQ